jgi:CRISPR/Cas system-associated exonuclease Cas4 (RecB family)
MIAQAASIAPSSASPTTPSIPTPKPRPKPKTIEQVLETVSASRLQLFHQCRLKFFFRYVTCLVKPRTSALFMGSMVHSVLQSWNLSRWRTGTFDLAKLKAEMDQNWTKEQLKQSITWDLGEEQEAKAESWTLFEIYLKHTPIALDEKPEGVEVALEVDLKDRGLPRLVGIIDLVRKGGRIVDFKTASVTPNSDKAEHMHELQLSCYSILYREATGQKEGGRELHHLVKLKTPKIVISEFPPMTNKQESRLFRILESYVNGVQGEDWVPSPNPMSCACCEYFNECRLYC